MNCPKFGNRSGHQAAPVLIEKAFGDKPADASNKIYMAKANQLFNVEDDAAKIKAKFRFIPAQSSAHHLDRGGERLRCQFLQGEGGPFDHLLDEPALSAVLREHGAPGRHRLYPPIDTLRLFIGQVLSANRACQDVVGRRLSERIANGQSASALSTSAYCDARQRLSLALPTTLSVIIAQRLESTAPTPWRWNGRRVLLFDGTSVSMPDTQSLQQAYPQSATQAAGLG